MRTRTEIDVLAGADPLTAVPDTDLAQHEQHARRILDQRRSEPAPRARRRRWRAVAVATAIATTMPVAAVIVVPDVVRQTGLPWVTDLTRSATAENGMIPGLSCGGGHGEAIRPDSAALRLWPTDLPAGWAVERVRAVRTSAWGWCTPPSLVAGRRGPDGTLTATVTVVGPNRDIQWSGEPRMVRDRVAGHPADEVRYPGMGTEDFVRWVVRTGEDEWEVTVNGLDRDDARAAADLVQFDGTVVSWQDGSGAPTFETLFQRTDPNPYPNRVWNGLEWTLVLTDPAGHERQVLVRRGAPGRQQGLTAELVVGDRPYVVDGFPALVNTRIATPYLGVEVLPAVVASMQVRGDRAQVEQLLVSLEDLPADDPRLDTYTVPGD